MTNAWTIAKRDIKSYFSSPIAYIVIAVFLGIMGWMFFFNLDHFFRYQLQFQRFGQGQGGGMSITDGIIRPLFGNMNVIFLFLVPFITMRVFAEEKKNQTIALLLTTPVRVTEIIFGKFLAVLALICTMLTVTAVYPAIIAYTGNPDLGPIFSSYLGIFLTFACYLSVGLFCSSLTENQIVAGALTFGILLFFWLISWAANSAPAGIADIINYLSLTGHFMNSFSKGIIDTSDVIFYLSYLGFWLFLTHRSLESYRWK